MAIMDSFNTHVMPTLEFGLAAVTAATLGGKRTQIAPLEYNRVFSDTLKTVAGSRYCPDIVAHLDLDVPRLDVRLAFRLCCHHFQLLTAQVIWTARNPADGDAPEPVVTDPSPAPTCKVDRRLCPSLLHTA